MDAALGTVQNPSVVPRVFQVNGVQLASAPLLFHDASLVAPLADEAWHPWACDQLSKLMSTWTLGSTPAVCTLGNHAREIATKS